MWERDLWEEEGDGGVGRRKEEGGWRVIKMHYI